MRQLWLVLALLAAVAAQDKPQPVLFEETTLPPTTTQIPKDATYWVTMSQKIRPGHPFNLNVQILKGTSSVDVGLTILNQDGTKVISAPDHFTAVPGEVQTFTFDVPMDLEPPNDSPWATTYQVNVVGKGDEVSFKHDNFLYLEKKSFSIFVQTDKAIYKPRQTVKFRILGMKPDLSVIRNEPVDVVIMDPDQNRIRQYMAVEDPNGRGVLELTFNLADGVSAGLWSINVEMLGQTEKKTFEVDNYVLPKFEVVIEAPPFGVSSDPIINITVRAKYTFGQPVTEGTVHVRVGPKRYNYGPMETKNEDVERKAKLNKDGEFFFQVTAKELLNAAKANNQYITALEWQTFSIQANVTEENTGRMQSASNDLQFYSSPLKMKFLDISPGNFKPGLKWTGYLEVKKQDDTLFSPAESRKIKIHLNVTYEVPYTKEELEAEKKNQNTTTAPPRSDGDALIPVDRIPIGFYPSYPRYKTMILDLPESMFTLPETGWITVSFDVPAEASSANIRAECMEPFKEQQAYKYLSKSESPTNSYLQLQLPKEKPKVGDTLNVKAESTDMMMKLNYQVYSKGMLLTSGIVNSQSTTGSKVIDFSIQVTQAMSPNMNLVVFYIREDNDEFVVDAISLSVEGLFKKPVSIEFSKEKVQPGEAVDVIVKAETDSVVFVLAVDKSVQLLGTGNDITQDSVREEMVQYDYGNFYPMWRYMFICGWPSYFGGSDATAVFQSANVLVFTDGLVYRRQNDDFFGWNDDRVFMAVPANSVGAAMPEASSPGGEFVPAETVRKLFPENWLWDSAIVTPDSGGQVVISTTSPDTITTWIASVFSVHPTYGLSVAKEPAKLTTFRDMFVTLDLPVSIVRGEDYCFTASVFNYYSQGELPILLTLDKSDDFDNIHAKMDGNTVTVDHESLYYSTFMGFLQENEIESTQFCLTPRKLGPVPVKVSALTNVNGLSDALIRTLHVKPEGVPRATSMPYMVDLANGAWEKSVTISFPASTVDGSQKITVSAAGNLLGPIFENLDDLLRKPYGCGEQNMLNFAPNIFLIEFYFTTSTMTDEIKQKAIEYMLIGYQKEIKYEHGSTGAYSTFGNNDNTDEVGSLWLTAFVTKCFAQAQMLNYKYETLVMIDTELIKRSANWMVTQQAKNGSFVEYGKVFNKRMQGGSNEGLALTAYTVIALHEASMVFENDTGMTGKIQSSLQTATDLLARNLNSMDDPYDVCIVTYALHLTNHAQKDNAFNKMESMANVGEGNRFWKRAEEKTQPYYWSASADAISIEMTSYALLVYGLRGQADTAGLPIVRWLTNQRGPNGGFISTQDTVIGLEALTSIATKIYTVEDIPITLTVSYVDVEGQTQSNNFNIDKSNELLLQSMNIPYMSNVPSSIMLKAVTDNGKSGPSSVLAEVVLDYNVKQETREENYKLSHDIKANGKGFELIITASAVSTEGSSMTILEVDIPAGHSPDTEMLTSYKTISKVEVDADKVVIYFQTDVIDEKGVTISVIMNPTGGILTKASPKFYRIYDYYSPDEEVTKEYMLLGQEKSFCSQAPNVGVCQYA